MKTYIYAYKGFVQFEVVLASYLLGTKGDIIIFSENLEPKKAMEGFTILPQMTIEDVKKEMDEVDCLIIPGGEPEDAGTQILDIIKTLNEKGKCIAGICGGMEVIERSGIISLSDFVFGDRNVVVHEHIVLSKPTGYVEFGIELGKQMNIYKDEKDYQETVNFFQYFKSEA